LKDVSIGLKVGNIDISITNYLKEYQKKNEESLNISPIMDIFKK